jgi:glutathione peroxidase
MYKLLLIVTGFLAFITGDTAMAQEKAESLQGRSAYDFSFRKIDGGNLPLSSFAGKTLLVVNTASKCGFTKQYDGLQKLYDTYKDRGLVVLGVPSNDFLFQEPGSNAEIKKFCETNFGITFPMTEKVHVKGKDADPFYLWVTTQKGGDVPGWNFHKFLISPEGDFVASFDSKVEPESEKLIQAIEANLH